MINHYLQITQQLDTHIVSMYMSILCLWLSQVPANERRLSICKVFSHWLRPSSATNVTHLSLDKMAAISQTIFSDAFLWMKISHILIKISLKFVPKGPIDNNPAMV